MSVSAMNIASDYGNVNGYDVYFIGADKKFFYKEENVRILHKIKNINIEKQDVYADGVNVHCNANVKGIIWLKNNVFWNGNFSLQFHPYSYIKINSRLN